MRNRRKVMRIAILCLAALLVLAALAWSLRAPILGMLPVPPVVITEHDNGTTVELSQGQRLEVRLPSNRDSKNVWRASMPLDYLPQESESTFTESESPAKAGDGYQSTLFRATGKGTGPLFMSYLPKDNANSYTPSMSFRVVVIVR
jgi:predicted secreted protein